MEALTNDTSEAVSFIISVMCHCFLTVCNAMCIVDVGVVGGTRMGAVVLSTVQLFNHAAHLISPALRSSPSGDSTFPFSATNCSLPMY